MTRALWVGLERHGVGSVSVCCRRSLAAAATAREVKSSREAVSAQGPLCKTLHTQHDLSFVDYYFVLEVILAYPKKAGFFWA